MSRLEDITGVNGSKSYESLSDAKLRSGVNPDIKLVAFRIIILVCGHTEWLVHQDNCGIFARKMLGFTPGTRISMEKCMDTKVIPSHVSPGGKILYVSERDQLVDAWFRMNWQINIGSEIVRGPLMFFEPEIYVTKEGIEPEFEIEVVDENGLPMYVRAIYSRFEP